MHIEDEYSMAEIEQRAAVYLRRRFALLCNDTQAEKNRQAAAQSNAAAVWRHGDVTVIGHGYRVEKAKESVIRTSEVHVAVSLDVWRRCNACNACNAWAILGCAQNSRRPPSHPCKHTYIR